MHVLSHFKVETKPSKSHTKVIQDFDSRLLADRKKVSNKVSHTKVKQGKCGLTERLNRQRFSRAIFSGVKITQRPER